MARISTWCVLSILLVLPWVVTSCDSPSGKGSAAALSELATPLSTAEKFVSAMNAADSAALEQVLTAKARLGMQAGSGFTLGGSPLERVVYGAAIEEAEAARITITATRDGKIEDVTLHMRPEEGEWRIHAFEVRLPGQGAMKLDLESMVTIAEELAESMAEGFQQAFEEGMREQELQARIERRQTFDRLRPLSADLVQTEWIVAEDHRGQPAARVIERLAYELGLPVRFGDADERLNAPVATDLVGLTRLAAIDRILADLDCHATYPAPHDLRANPIELPPLASVSAQPAPSLGSGYEGAAGSANPSDLGGSNSGVDLAAIEVQVGPEPYPVAHVGPFRVTIAELEQSPEYATGTVTVVSRAYGLDPAIGGASQSLNETTRFEQVADPRGRELRQSPDVHFLGGGEMIRGATGGSTSLDLHGLLVDVTEIATLRGTRTLAIPAAVETLMLDPLTVGETGTIAGVEYEVKSVGRSIQIAFRGNAETLEGMSCIGVPISANGEDISVESDSTMAWGRDEVQYQLQAKEDPARLEVRCVLDAVELAFPFVLEGIALPDHAKAPRALPALEFAGVSTPISIEFQRLIGANEDFPKVELTVHNHSNKDVATISCTFEYLDTNGKKLEDFPHSLNAPSSFDGPAALVVAGKKVPHETTAFFVPEGTRSVAMTITEVRFLDATVWTPPTE